MERFKCCMCYFIGVSTGHLEKHVVRFHRNDPLFKVKCTYSQCGATFIKWRSYKTHVNRYHPGENLLQNNDVLQNNQIDIPNAPHMEQPIDVSMEELKWNTVKFILDARENCKLSQVATEMIVDGVMDFTKVYTFKLLNDIRNLRQPDTNFVDINQIERLLNQNYDPDMLFQDVKSKWYLDKFLMEQLNMVPAMRLKMGTTLKWVKKNEDIPHLIEVEDTAYYVPFLKNLENLLRNQEVRENLDQGNVRNDGVLRTVLDGTYYRENESFQRLENPLAIIIYYDEIGIANPLSGYAKPHKLAMFYWSLANLRPEFRSRQHAIQLLAIVKVAILKKYGLKKVLRLFINDLKIFRTRGLRIIIQGREFIFKGLVIFGAGDTPASAHLGGFKESVSAYLPCRSCLTTKDEWKLFFKEDDFVPRNAETYEQHVQAVTVPNVPKQTTSFWKREYGVNGRSPLLEIMDVTECLPQDAMHLFPDGALEICTRALLRHYIVEEELFSLEELNEKIRVFDFGHFKDNKPGVILRDHLERNATLKQTASQMLALAHTLPFLIGEWLTDDEDIVRPMKCHIRMMQIVNVCFAYEIHIDTTYVLERMIELFIIEFKELYPGWIVPKFHFIVHLPRYIRMFGPARQQWCFAFERKHAYFKQLVPVVKSFRNMAFSMCYRHQANLAVKLAAYPGNASRNFLYQGHQVTFGQRVLLNNLPHGNLFFDFIPIEERETTMVLRCPQVTAHGTQYKPESIILLECDENSLPKFGVIKEIFSIKDELYFIYIQLETTYFAGNLNSYKIKKPIVTDQRVIALPNLLFPHAIPQFEYEDDKYVILLDHERTEFYG